MSKIFRINPFLRMFTDGKQTVKVSGNTVGECIDELEAKYPGVKEQVMDGDGNLLRYVGIYVNSESTYPDELSKKVKDGDEITIITFIGGG
jgi:molybdopterin synthase sulfur carrier subunit